MGPLDNAYYLQIQKILNSFQCDKLVTETVPSLPHWPST